jgi:hypothetical protein
LSDVEVGGKVQPVSDVGLDEQERSVAMCQLRQCPSHRGALTAVLGGKQDKRRFGAKFGDWVTVFVNPEFCKIDYFGA